MNSIIKKIFFSRIPAKEFTGIAIFPDEITEKVYLVNDKQPIYTDISKIHWLLCLEPMVIGICLDELLSADKYELFFYKHKPAHTLKNTAKVKPVASMTLQYMHAIHLDNKHILLLQVKNTRLYHTNFINRGSMFVCHYLITQRNTFQLTWQKFKNLAASYSFPRNVVLISVQNGDYFNIFPMDLQGSIGNICLLGLRHTNASLAKIIERKQVVLCEIPAAYKEIIYQLGKYHSTQPLAKELLPFKIFSSKNFQFPVPVFTIQYKEITLIDSYNLGSQMLLVGKVYYEQQNNNMDKQLHHIHALYTQ